MSYLAIFFLLAGAFFGFIAALGVVRMPDLYCRMHAATKAGAFGLSLMLVGLIFYLPELRVVLQSILIIVFFYLTAPLAAHLLGRVGLRKNVPMFEPDGQQEDKH